MSRKIRYATFVVAVITAVVALAAAEFSAPAAVKPGGGATASGPFEEPKQYFKLAGDNCYLVFSNYGLFGCGQLVEDYGFHYNTDRTYPPESYEGAHSWGNSPSRLKYNNFVDSTTTMPSWVALPAGATSVTVEYYAKWDIELNYDGVELEIAESATPTKFDNLRPTSAVLGSGMMGQPDASRYYYEGWQGLWKKETADLTAYKGKSVKLQFHLRTDTSGPEPHRGIYVDALRILANGSTVVYQNYFNASGNDAWDTRVIRGNASEDAWGFSQALPAECVLLNTGTLLAGTASSYVVDGFGDWEPAWGAWPNLVHYSNGSTRQPAQPEFRVEQFLYAYPQFIIVDAYIKNGKPETVSNAYAGIALDFDVRHNYFETGADDRVVYRSDLDLALFYDDAQENYTCVGVVYLNAKGEKSTSVNFENYINYTTDATTWPLISNGQHDYNGTPSAANYWAVAVGKGPYSLKQGETIRFAFAIVGGINGKDIENNTLRAREEFKKIPDNTPVGVTPASLGRVKAVFR